MALYSASKSTNLMRLTSTLLLTIALGLARAQPTFSTIYNFQGGPGGGVPFAGLFRASDGTFFGTTTQGLSTSGGVFQLSPPSSSGGSWTEATIASIGSPYWSGVVLGPTQEFYGTAGNALYQLAPPKKKGEVWTVTSCTLYALAGYGVIVGPDGVLYGTTQIGVNNSGSVFQMNPPISSGGQCRGTVLHSFAQGEAPVAGVVLGPNGALYGATPTATFGEVFELAPPASPGGEWTYSTIYSFTGAPSDGWSPTGDLVVNSNGVLYGVTYGGGASNYGTIYSLTPPATSGGAWTEQILHSFDGTDGAYPIAGLALGTTGTLFGSTSGVTQQTGTIFSLQPPASSADWSLSTLHRFSTGEGYVQGELAIGSDGALFGTSSLGGASEACADGCGYVFRVTH